MEINELIENFELLEDWEDKYRYLIDLGGGWNRSTKSSKPKSSKLKAASRRSGWFPN